MKAVWQGSISFGLVSIPVKLIPASEPKLLSFRMLCPQGHKIHYKRICEKEKKEVKWDEIVRGLEVAKGKYYTFKREELAAIRPERTDFIEVKQFVEKAHIDPIYFAKHYYVVPEKEKDKAYFLFRELLALAGKAGIATFVMRDKQYTASISAYKTGILLTTLSYAYEVRDISKLVPAKAPVSIGKQEIALGEKLMEQLEEEFDIKDWKDEYADELKKLIKAKMAGKAVKVKKAKRPVKAKKLLEALKASVG